MNTLEEVAGKPCRIRLGLGDGGPFGGTYVNFLARILDYDPVCKIWKIQTTGGGQIVEAYIQEGRVETWALMTEEEYQEEYAAIEKRQKERAAKQKPFEDDAEYDAPASNWYGDLDSISNLLSELEKKEKEG